MGASDSVPRYRLPCRAVLSWVDCLEALEGEVNRRAYILVPGIRTRTDDNQAWAVTWADRIMQRYKRTMPAASEFRYFVGALSRRMSQQRYARQLAAMIENWYDAGFSIVVVCHSNGADLLSRALDLTAAHIETAHLIAAA